jgi:hypothetical protein
MMRHWQMLMGTEIIHDRGIINCYFPFYPCVSEDTSRSAELRLSLAKNDQG